MEILTYLIKVNIAIGLFYGFYALFFRNDTFFQWKRILLLSVFFLCILYPFVDISKQVLQSKMLAHAIQNAPIFPTYYLNEVVITGQAKSYSLWNHLPEIMTGIYYIAMACLIVWMLMQIAGVVSMLIKTSTIEINGQKVYLKKGLKTPFSFFDCIVLDPEQCNENELEEILRHEKTHVRQWHSLDMLITDLMCAICWFNPFVWLLKRELRINLEYLADRSVINSGCDTEHYQLHLLRLSYHKAAATLINNFNVSPLKKRILMMNKKQSPAISILKYALVIPLFAVLLFFNSCLKTDKQHIETDPATEPEATTIADVSVAIEDSAFVQTLNDAIENELPKDVKIYEHVEVMPQFPGGDEALRKWLQDNIQFPTIAAEKGIQGRVVVRFVVSPSGKIENVSIQKSIDPACDKEAIRVVKTMPDWIPGKMGGKGVYVYFSLPINFKSTIQ